MEVNFISYLIERKVIPEASKGIWQFVADDQLKEMLVRFDVITEQQSKQLWREYIYMNRGNYGKIS